MAMLREQNPREDRWGDGHHHKSTASSDIRAAPHADRAPCQLYIPASRVFCMSDPIPFHLSLLSSAYSLAAFMPYAPTASLLAVHKQHMSIQLLRQSVVDVRSVFSAPRGMERASDSVSVTPLSSAQKLTFGVSR